MNIIKASALTFIATAIKIISGIIINKAISIFIGPSGLAIIGQFQNASSIIQTVANGGIANGVIKYTAESTDKNENKKTLWSTALKLITLLSIITSLVIFIFSANFSSMFFHQENLSFIFIVFSLTLLFFSINQLLLNIISGLGEFQLYTRINIIQSIYSLVFTTALIVYFNLSGALVAMVTNQSIVFFIILWLLRKHPDIVFSNFTAPFCTKQLKKLVNYSAMTFSSALSLSVSLLIVRNYIGEHLSWDHAGYWQAMNYLSSMYLMLITIALSNYYLPKLSAINSKNHLIKEVCRSAIFLLPLAIVLATGMYVLKGFIISFLFSDDFSTMLILFKWHLIGDVIKVSSYLLSYLMLAKAMTKIFIFTDIISAILFTILSVIAISLFGFVGLSYAYLVNNVFCLLIMLIAVIFYFKTY